MAQVVLEGVGKTYPGGVVAATDIDLAVADGEFLVLVGPSGCGKSTVLRMIAGLEEITTGTIRIGDRVVNDVEPRDRDIAMVFQNYALYPHMTVRANMAFGLKLRGVPRDEIDRRVAEASRILGIADLLDRRPRALSGGQRQRVALGRAIVRDPAVFLFDEPLSNLDAKMRVQMRTEISRLHHRLGATMIYVTHDQVEAMTMGQRIVVLKDGRVQQVDTPLALYDRPVNRFVAGFIGSPAMNFLDGRLVRDDGVALVTAAGTRLGLPGFTPPASALDRPVTLGVRPEHLAPADGDAGFTLPVQVVEPLGNETLLYFRVDDTDLVVRVPGAAVLAVETPVGLRAQPDHLHLFDPDSGRSLTAG